VKGEKVFTRLCELPSGHVERRLAEGLPALYSKSLEAACVIATLCDTYLDRSGNLLGYVRTASLSEREA